MSAIGAMVPNSSSVTDGRCLSGRGIASTTCAWPLLGLAPRFGMAYDMSGRQKMVVRGGAGLYYDRPSGNSIFAQVQNPPTLQNVTVRYGQLQTVGSAGLEIPPPPALTVFEHNAALPASVQWNGGLQMSLPWSILLVQSYVGH